MFLKNYSQILIKTIDLVVFLFIIFFYLLIFLVSFFSTKLKTLNIFLSSILIEGTRKIYFKCILKKTKVTKK